MDRRFHVVWRVRPQPDLVQMSGLLSGLGALARQGAISWSSEFVDDADQVGSSVMELVVTDRQAGLTRNVAFDFYDAAARIVPTALTFADVYFKRQLDATTRPAAPPELAHKIRPLGLTIAGYSHDALTAVFMAIVGSLRSRHVRRTRSDLVAAIKHAIGDARLWVTLPASVSAEVRDSDVKREQIVFQPRVWHTTTGSGDVFEIANADRIATVRALRMTFPNDRAIGLIRSSASLSLSPDLLLDGSVSTSAYHRQLRTSTIGVNCHGLNGSVGWKLSEYFASANAVVSQPIAHEFLSAIEAGVNYLPYRTPDECVAQCLRLRADTALATAMGKTNREYYQRWVHPPAHALHLLNRSFE